MIARLVSSPLRIYLIALLGGAVMPLAFAPFGWSPVAWLSLTGLFGAWSFVTPKHAFRSGYLFGLGMFGAGVSWVFVSMHDFGGVAVPVAVFLTALFVAFLALFPALAGFTYARWLRSDASPLSLLAGLPALWTLIEWCRGWIFTGFPWLEIGYSQVDTPLAGYAAVLGTYSVTWIAALVVAYGVAALLRQVSWRHCIVVWGVVFSLGIGLKSIAWATPTGKPIEVALLQGNVSQDIKWRPEQRQPTVDLYVSMTRENWDADLVIWPETALPAFAHQARELLVQMGAEARSTNTDVLIGVPVMDPESRRYYNSMVAIGSHNQAYSKQHLVPFGEYVPWDSFLGRVMEIMQVPLPDFSVTPSSPVLTLAGQPMGISICYEDAFGGEVIQALPDATVLINASNDAWFGDSLAPHQHQEMARMRAIETQRPMLRVTNTGITAIIDHRGAIADAAPQFTVAVLRGRVQPMRGATPYARMGNAPVIAIVFGLAGLAYWARRRVAARF